MRGSRDYLLTMKPWLGKTALKPKFLSCRKVSPKNKFPQALRSTYKPALILRCLCTLSPLVRSSLPLAPPPTSPGRLTSAPEGSAQSLLTHQRVPVPCSGFVSSLCVFQTVSGTPSGACLNPSCRDPPGLNFFCLLYLTPTEGTPSKDSLARTSRHRDQVAASGSGREYS